MLRPALIIVILFGFGCRSEEPISSATKPDAAQNSIGTSDSAPADPQASPRSALTRTRIEAADVSVLFIGNSHSSPIPQLLTEIYSQQQPDRNVLVEIAGFSGFLADHLSTGSTPRMIELGPWDFVVLQAQKYSTSGKFDYPHDAALELSDIAKSVGAKVIMYPEWSRLGVPNEYQRIRDLHEMIAAKTGATVAPIGESWEAVLAQNPNLVLHAQDGNHATRLGSYLNASVFYSMIAGESPEGQSSPDETQNEFQRRQLERIAWSEVRSIFGSN